MFLPLKETLGLWGNGWLSVWVCKARGILLCYEEEQKLSKGTEDMTRTCRCPWLRMRGSEDLKIIKDSGIGSNVLNIEKSIHS